MELGEGEPLQGDLIVLYLVLEDPDHHVLRGHYCFGALLLKKFLMLLLGENYGEREEMWSKIEDLQVVSTVAKV